MTRTGTDILISGGGIAGLAAAAAFGTAGFSVICVDPAPQAAIGDAGASPKSSLAVTEATALDPLQPNLRGSDLRTTAILQPGRDLLAAAGVWEALAPHATPLQVMRILDATGGGTPRDFDAADVSTEPFGWNLPNHLIHATLLAHVRSLPGVEFRAGTGTAGVLTRASEALVSLSDGTTVAARLLVAADGRESPVREALGIGVRTFRTGQKALTFAVTHPVPHRNVSTEIHRSGGPFTLVPLPDRNSMPASAVVWMETGPEAARLAALSDADFESAATDRSAHVQGSLTLASPRTLWPIISQLADRMAGERTALMAEAAHVMPPIGAQGLNTSLADLAELLRLAQADRAGLGSPAMLERYHRARHGEVRLRMLGVGALNAASMAGGGVATAIRGAGLGVLHDIAPVRRALMRAGLGQRGPTAR